MIPRRPLLILLACVLGAGCSQPEASSEGGRCGGSAGIACVDPLWCDLEGGLCEAADVAGMCVVVPEICTRDYRPMCGCDGRTYGNDCERKAARAQLDHAGECAQPES